MERICLGWFCSTIKKFDTTLKKNQETFVNEFINKLIITNNPQLSYIRHFNSTLCNRIIKQKIKVPDEYKEGLPLSQEKNQIERMAKLLTEPNEWTDSLIDFHFDFEVAMHETKRLIQRILMSQINDANQIWLEKLLSILSPEEFIATTLFYLVNYIPNEKMSFQEFQLKSMKNTLIDKRIIKDLEIEIGSFTYDLNITPKEMFASNDEICLRVYPSKFIKKVIEQDHETGDMTFHYLLKWSPNILSNLPVPEIDIVRNLFLLGEAEQIAETLKFMENTLLSD